MTDYGVFLDFLYDRVHSEINDSLDPEFWDYFEQNLDIIVSDFEEYLLTSDNKCDNM